MKLPRVSPGDDIRAEHVNAIYEAAEGLGLAVDAASGLAVTHGPHGKHLGINRRFRGWIKITGPPTGASYPWSQQLPASGGGWATGPASGTAATDGAKEANGDATVPNNTVVWAERAATSSEIVFVY